MTTRHCPTCLKAISLEEWEAHLAWHRPLERCPHHAAYGEEPRICIECGSPIEADNVVRLRRAQEVHP